MNKEFCIWLRSENKVQHPGKPAAKATYEQMISEGWKPEYEGDITIVFSKESSCNSVSYVPKLTTE